MTEAKARDLVPGWAGMISREEAQKMRKIARFDLDRFKKRYGIALILAALFCLYSVLLIWRVRTVTETRLRQEMAAAVTQAVEDYKTEEARQAQAEHWLSGDASFEAFLNQEIDAGTRFVQEEPNDTMRGTKLGVALARLMSGLYGSTLQEVINQPEQWMNYRSDVKITQEVRSFVEKILRAYYVDGIIPDDLTADIQWITWTPGDYLARNNYNASAATKTWRYHG